MNNLFAFLLGSLVGAPFWYLLGRDRKQKAQPTSWFVMPASHELMPQESHHSYDWLQDSTRMN